MHRSRLPALFAIVIGIPFMFGIAITALLASWPAFLAGVFVPVLSLVLASATMTLLDGDDQ